MADLDEDVIHHPPSSDSAPQAEIDLSDEMQDFRFLNSLSLCVADYSILFFWDELLICQKSRHLTGCPPPPRRKGL